MASEPEPWKLHASAEALRRRGRPREALALLSGALASSGRPAWLYLLRFRLRRLAGLPGAARDVDLAFRAGGDGSWVFGLGPAPAALGPGACRLRAALSPFSRAPQSAPVHAYLGQARLSSGKKEQGLRALRRASRLEPAGWIRAWLGEAERQAGRLDRAHALFDQAVRLDPRYANAYAWRGTVLLQKGRWAEARADLDRALRLGPTARAHHDRSRARRRLSDWDGALDDLERAVRLNPELGWGRPAELAASLSEIRAALRRRPRDPRLWAWRGETLLRLGRLSEALSALDRAVRLDPRFGWARAWRAEARAAREGPSARVRRELETAARLDPSYARGLWLLAECFFAAGDYRSALRSMDRALRLSPYSARLFLARAKLQLALGARAAAVRDLDRALRLCPVYPEAESLRAWALSAPRARR